MAEKKAALLSKESILAAQDVTTERVEVPEWGGAVLVRGLTGAERDAFEGEVVQRNGRDVKTNTRNMRARLVVLSVVDEQGARLFGFADIETLGAKSARALDRVFAVAMRLSGLRDEDVEELTERFDGTPQRRLVFRLALALGRTVEELLGGISSRELSEWMAFDRVEPIGGRRSDLQAGVVAATIANVHRAKGQRAYDVTDFVPEYGAPQQTMDADALVTQQLGMWKALKGG